LLVLLRRLLISKLLDAMLTSDADFGIPVRSPTSGEGASRGSKRDTPTASAIKKTQSMHIVSSASHGKAVSVDAAATERSADDGITFDPRQLTVCVLPKDAKDKLAAAVRLLLMRH
jgi:hypothetical protein